MEKLTWQTLREAIWRAGTCEVKARAQKPRSPYSKSLPLTSHYRSTLRHVESTSRTVWRCKVTVDHSRLTRTTRYREPTLSKPFP